MTDDRRAPAALDRLVVPSLILLALALRVREALRAPLWFDELWTRSAADRPWPDVMRVVRADIHPPLFFALAHLWRVFGNSDLAVRSLSLLCATAGLCVGYALVREWFGRGSARLALLLVALHPWHVYVSQETRGYALVGLALAAAWLGAWRWSERERHSDAVLFVLAAAVALWTHYVAAIPLAVLAGWGVVRFAREPVRLGRWLALQAAIAVLFAPLLPLLWSQLHLVREKHWLPPPHFADLVDTARRMTFGNSRLVLPALALALWPLADARSRRAAGFALTTGPLSLLVSYALGTHGLSVFAYKYMMFVVWPLLGLMAAGTLRLPGRVTRWVVAIVLVAFAVNGLRQQPAYPQAASFGLVRERIGERVRPGDVMFHADAHVYLFGRRYFPALRHRLVAMGQEIPYYEGRAVVPDSAFASAAELRAAAASGAHWWGLSWGRGALNDIAFRACADSFAAAPAETCGLVHVWSGVPTR